MAFYIGVNETAREVKRFYIGVNDVAREIRKGYIGDANNLARQFYTSQPSINISYTSLPTLGYKKNMAYGNGKYVAVSYNSADVIYSVDGINWNSTSIPSASQWNKVVFGNDTFVITTINRDYAKVAYSKDGVSWREGTMPQIVEWYALTFGNGKFVALPSPGNQMAYSTDGVNWRSSTLPASMDWRTVIYANNKFVALANSYSQYINYNAVYSTDGITWTRGNLPNLKMSVAFSNICFGNGIFISVSSNYLFYSYDGINWSYKVSNDYTNISSIVFAENIFISIGNWNSILGYSFDGLNWEFQEIPNIIFLNDISYCNGKIYDFIASASGGTANNDKLAIMSIS